jgi:hypothetical protein
MPLAIFVDENFVDVVLRFIERLSYRFRGTKRNFVLAGAATGQKSNTDFLFSFQVQFPIVARYIRNKKLATQADTWVAGKSQSN